MRLEAIRLFLRQLLGRLDQTQDPQRAFEEMLSLLSPGGRFITAAELLENLQSQSPESLRRRVSRFAQSQLLCIDEVGYLSYDNHAADLLYKVVDRRYERRSILLTTNLAFRDWNTVFPNATSIASLLDKLTHHADITVIEGQSYRVHESQKEAAARRKQP